MVILFLLWLFILFFTWKTSSVSRFICPIVSIKWVLKLHIKINLMSFVFINMNPLGWPEEVWVACKLAERLHNGGPTDAVEEGDECFSQQKTGSASRRQLLLVLQKIIRMVNIHIVCNHVGVMSVNLAAAEFATVCHCSFIVIVGCCLILWESSLCLRLEFSTYSCLSFHCSAFGSGHKEYYMTSIHI